MVRADAAQGPVRPGRLVAAVVNAVGVAVLPLLHCLADRHFTVFRVEVGDSRHVRLIGLVVPDLGHEEVDQFLEEVVFGVVAAFVVDEIPVEVDVVLVLAPEPRHAVRIKGVDEQHGGARSRLRRIRVSQQADLDTRSGVTLHAMGRRSHDDHAACGAVSDPGCVAVERLPLGSTLWIAVTPDGCAGVATRGEEAFPCLGIRCRKVFLRHV